ncbi:hypothetical protein [Microterricola pindariensis]|uniref:hypothetical protein n=1 Tax=Microterricola pindariensis TaxID=478010 RepID=UPI001056F4CB|nr:hypothetical protein [Microterricola pindariensis]
MDNTGRTGAENTENSGTQDEPVMEQDAVSDREKLEGIIDQTIADVGPQRVRHIAGIVRERSAESGLSIPEDEQANAISAAVGRHTAHHPAPGSAD